MAYSRGTLDRATYGSLGSSVGCLDGVPFKVTAQFRPPPQVILPPDLESRGQHSAVSNEYLFETEEAVLAWARAREEAARARVVAATEAVADAIEQFAQSPRHQRASNSDSDSDELELESAEANSNQASADPVPKNSNAPPRPITATMYDNILTPTPICSGQAHPSAEGASKPTGGLDLALFEKEDDPFDNLVLKTIDDMAELQTVLGSSSSSQVQKTEAEPIYENSNEGNTNSSNSYLTEDGEPVVDDISMAPNGEVETELKTTEVMVQSLEITESKRPLPTPPPQAQCPPVEKGLDAGDGESALPIVEEGDYVQIRQDYRKGGAVAFRRSSEGGVRGGSWETNGNAASPPTLGGHLPTNLASSKLYKAVLPPIPAPRQSRSPAQLPPTWNGTDGVAPGGGSGTGYPGGESVGERESAVGAAGVSTAESNRNRYSRHSMGVEPMSDGEGGGAGCGVPRGMRNAQSSPDLSHGHRRSEHTASTDQDGPMSWQGPMDRSQSPMQRSSPLPPARYSPLHLSSGPGRSSPQPSREAPTPPPRPSSQQAWNRYRPLPPPPSPSLGGESGPENSTSSSGPSVPGSTPPAFHGGANPFTSSTSQHGSPTPPPYSASPPPYSALPPISSVPAPDLPPPPGYSLAGALGADPYSTMSVEARRFVDSLVSMGFSKPRVARAVEKLGQDAKEVTDHLFNVDKLVEKGYNPLLAETALHLYDNNLLKAERYLAMFKQFQELGFGADKIKEALVTNDMDRDKALDFLTA